VLAVEIRRYQSADSSAGVLVPRLIGQTAWARDSEQPPAEARGATRWSAQDVMAAAAQAGEGAAAVARTVSERAAKPRLVADFGQATNYLHWVHRLLHILSQPRR
jgi:hypothetical protein